MSKFEQIISQYKQKIVKVQLSKLLSKITPQDIQAAFKKQGIKIDTPVITNLACSIKVPVIDANDNQLATIISKVEDEMKDEAQTDAGLEDAFFHTAKKLINEKKLDEKMKKISVEVHCVYRLLDM